MFLYCQQLGFLCSDLFEKTRLCLLDGLASFCCWADNFDSSGYFDVSVLLYLIVLGCWCIVYGKICLFKCLPLLPCIKFLYCHAQTALYCFSSSSFYTSYCEPRVPLRICNSELYGR